MARPFFPSIVVCLLTGLAVAEVRAESPPEELLRYVPEDVGFCLMVQDLRGHAVALKESPFAEHFWKSPPGQALAGSKELDQLDKVDRQLRAVLGVGWKTFAEEVLGEAVGFAYRPGPPGEPDQETGLILLRARDPDALAKLLERINTMQKLSGELLSLEPRTHNGVRYFTRVEAGKKTSHYLLSGPVVVYSGQEEMLRQAIDQRAGGPAVPPVARRFKELGIDQSLVAFWLNPRAFDSALDAEIGRAMGVKEGEAEPLPKAREARTVALRQFARYWKALDSIGFSVVLGRELALSLSVRARTEEFPPAARRFLAEAARPSAVWGSFPEEPLFAFAGRIDVAALFEVFTDFLPKEQAAQVGRELTNGLGAILGKDPVADILPALGPDWGLCVAAPPVPSGSDSGASAWFPDLLLAIRVQPHGEEAAVDAAIVTALLFGARLLVLGHNKENPDSPLALKTARHGKAPVHYLTGERALPDGVRPALSLQAGYLVLASAPEVLSRLSLGGVPQPSPGGKDVDSPGVPLLRVSFRQWGAYLTLHRQAIARNMAKKNDLTVEEADRRLGDLLDVLPLLDRLEFRQRTTPGQMALTLSVRPTRPLRK